jgi:threonine/homoserine/homoserine lactone efflux protein
MAGESPIAFATLALVVTLTPGPNMALVIRTAAASGAPGGIRATLGIATGLAVWAVASAAGVAAVLEASPGAFVALQASGGMWLVFLGLRSLRRSPTSLGSHDAPGQARADFRAGIITILLNPLAGAFYLAALPGFVSPGPMAPVISLVLALIHIVMVVSWFSLCSALIARGATRLTRPGARQLLQRVSGLVLIAFGIRVMAALAA